MVFELPSFLYNFFIPFLLSFTLTYAALQVFKLFDKRINLVIALSLTLIFSASPFFKLFTTYLPYFSAIFIFGLFVIVFMYGSFRKSEVTLKEVGKFEYKRKKEELVKQLEGLNKKFEEALQKAVTAEEKQAVVATYKPLIDDIKKRIKILDELIERI
jgi:predicted PurR-regulated permease PerM